MSSLESQAAGDQLVLFPLDDKAVRLCSKIDLKGGWLLAGPNGTRADLALNKYLQVEAARNAGFNIPQSALFRTASELFAFCAEASYPIILKQNECVPIVDGRVFSCRKWICANREELERAIAEWKERVPLLAQSFITGV